MYKVVLSSLVLISMSSWVSAQEIAPSAILKAPVAEKVLKGRIKSISLADVSKDTRSEIVVTEENGKTMVLLIKTTTTLYDPMANAMTLDKMAAGSRVNVLYMTTPEGMNIAKSVKVLK